MHGIANVVYVPVTVDMYVSRRTTLTVDKCVQAHEKLR